MHLIHCMSQTIGENNFVFSRTKHYGGLVRSIDELHSDLVESQTDIEREFSENQGSQHVSLR